MVVQSIVLRRAGRVTWAVLAACVLFTLITRAGQSTLTSWFLLQPQALLQGQLWRLLTPTFLHFTILDSPILHLLFNGLIWLNFAGLIEAEESSRRLFWLFLLTAIGSNLVAYGFYGANFGGLSGVVFALIGYLWLRSKNLLLYRNIMPDTSFVVFIGFALVGFTGLFGNMANMAHVAGLLLGLAFAGAVNALSSDAH